MKTIQVFDDIQQVYAEFLENKAYPKLESLSNWGKNRFFFSQYFRLIETGTIPNKLWLSLIVSISV